MSDPQSFSQAHGIQEWDDAMVVVYSYLIKNKTWDQVLPKGRKLVCCKWVYPTKYAADGSIDKYKARLVAKGFSHVKGVDYSKSFAPIACTCNCCITRLVHFLDGCEGCFLTWRFA